MITYRIFLETSTFGGKSHRSYKTISRVETVQASTLGEAREKAIAQTTLKAGVRHPS